MNRDVAIKILPPFFAGDRDRVRRFHREAQLLASLSHPHIGSIYGLEENDTIGGLVLELVEGETLAERISRGPARVEEAVVIGRQIADALNAAHARGIVHRDLKPANIKITVDGVVKVLDFGLAKIFGTDRRAEHSSDTVLSTKENVILGTIAYMSPEQARGKEVDNRTDIWAWGCVMYELLTGHARSAVKSQRTCLRKLPLKNPIGPGFPINAGFRADSIAPMSGERSRSAAAECRRGARSNGTGVDGTGTEDSTKAVVSLCRRGGFGVGLGLRCAEYPFQVAVHSSGAGHGSGNRANTRPITTGFKQFCK